MKDFQTFKFVLHKADNFFNFISECISKPLSVHQEKKKKKKKLRHLVKLRAIFLLFILVFVILLFEG